MTPKIIEWNPILKILVLSSHQRMSLTIALVNAFSDRPLVNQSEWKTCCLLSQSFLFGTLIRKIKLFRLRDSLLIYKKIIFYPFCIIHRKYTQKTIKLFLFTHNFFSFFLAKILKSRLYSLTLYERKIKFWHLILIYCTWFLTKMVVLVNTPPLAETPCARKRRHKKYILFSLSAASGRRKPSSVLTFTWVGIKVNTIIPPGLSNIHITIGGDL